MVCLRMLRPRLIGAISGSQGTLVALRVLEKLPVLLFVQRLSLRLILVPTRGRLH